MAQFILMANPVVGLGEGYETVSLDLSGTSPRKRVEAKKLPELIAAFEDWKKEIEATGKCYRLGVTKHPRCPERKPAGFDKARDRGGPLSARVNDHAAPAR